MISRLKKEENTEKNDDFVAKRKTFRMVVYHRSVISIIKVIKI